MGNQEAAQRHFNRGFACPSPLNVQLFGLDNRVRALVTFDRVLWLCGSADRALEIAREAIAEAAKLSKPLNVCFSLLYTAPVFLWCGEFGAARDVLEKLMTHPNFHALPSLHATAHALQGELLIRTGDAERGVTLLRSALLTMRADRQSLMLARATCVFAEGLTLIGQHDEALAVIGNAITAAVDGEKTAEFPELLRVRAEILLSKPQPDESEVEDCLVRALTVARRQSALSWELRVAMTLARVQARRGRSDEARQLLSCVHSRFTEGFETGDLKAARQLLTELDEAALSHPHTTRSNRADSSITSRRFT
jgi:predicted ATPase